MLCRIEERISIYRFKESARKEKRKRKRKKEKEKTPIHHAKYQTKKESKYVRGPQIQLFFDTSLQIDTAVAPPFLPASSCLLRTSVMYYRAASTSPTR